MSDVLIKGMEMPKACLNNEGLNCPCLSLCEAFKNNDAKENRKEAWDHRLNGCFLVEVLPHGDLIDAHAFATKVAEAQDKLKGKDYDPFMLLGDVLRWIALAPVIIEASTDDTKGRKK